MRVALNHQPIHIRTHTGMERIYETFPQICRFRGAGHEADDLRRLMRCYKEWAHALFPQLAFEDLLDRVQKLSGRARVRKRLDELREKERERFLVRPKTEEANASLLSL